MKNHKTVTTIYGMDVVVDLSTRKVTAFSNKDKEITYNAAVVENGKPTGFYTDYKEAGTVTDLETKVNTFGNAIALAYATAVKFDATKNDPDKKIWSNLLKHIQENESKFFTKAGDFRKQVTIDISKLI